MATEYCNAFLSYEKDNFAKAKKELDPLAFKDNVKAQNLLGLVNIHLNQSFAAQKWFQNAAVKGDLKAAYNLGIYYYNKGNIEQTEKWMRVAEGLNEAKFALGVLFAGTYPQKAKAFFYIPAMQGNTYAKAHLCAMPVINGDKNNDKYKQLCGGFKVQASLITGKFYDTTKRYGSISKALYYLKYAADQGNVEAINRYGTLLYKRRGPTDEEIALSYFLKASALGDVDAQVNAAWIYYVGQKWTRKPGLGFQELTAALKQNNEKAKLYMGILMIKGSTFSFGTVQQNVNQGFEYIREAAAQNDVEAIQYMIDNGARGEELQRYQEQLSKYYRDENRKKALHFLVDGC
jgi:TPR repeat protein